MSESVILCEGYHDRAFWAGWLTHLGCVDPGIPAAGKTSRNAIYDPWNTKVQSGQFAYHSRVGRFLRVVPCHGKTQVLTALRTRLKQRNTKAVLRLVVSVDADTSGSGSSPLTGLRRLDVLHQVQQIDASACLNADGEIEVDATATKIGLIRWETPDSPNPGLPSEQTLERLVCASMIAAYPARADAVRNWLASRPQPPAASPKEHAWSYMAGWYADQGCEAFYLNLWHDPLVVSQLEARLRASGGWQTAEMLAG